MVLAAWVLLVCAFTAPALGQQGPDSAEAYYKQGMEHFYREDYSLAIANFKRAHAIEAHGIFQYNISVAASRLGNLKEARDAANEALELGGLPEDVELKVQSRLRAYDAVVAARRATSSVASSKGRAAAGNQTPGPASPAAPTASTPDSGLSALGWTGVAVGSLGLSTLAAAGVLDWSVGAHISDYDKARAQGDRAEANRLRSEIVADQRLGRWMVYGGGAAVLVGATLLSLEWVGGESESAKQVRVAPSPGGASVEFQWGF